MSQKLHFIQTSIRRAGGGKRNHLSFLLRSLVIAASQFLLGCQCLLGHSSSTGFLLISRDNGSLSLSLELPLRDLDELLGLDANDDGKLTWGELKDRENNLIRYVESRLVITDDGHPASLRYNALSVNRHQDEGYAVLGFELHNHVNSGTLTLEYRVLMDHDPLHRCLTSSPSDGITAVMSRDRPQIRLNGPASFPTHAMSLVAEGAHHIWTGYDHLLFLLALLLPSVLRRTDHGWAPVVKSSDSLREIFKVVTAFTVAHSLTLSAAALGLIHLPPRLVESSIAASIMIAALANLRSGSGGPSTTHRKPVQQLLAATMKPWTVAFVFGLIHGFGFAGALNDLGLSHHHTALPLVAFNTGVELGQLVCVAAFLPLAILLRKTSFYRRTALPLGSIAIILLAGGWMTERIFEVSFMPF
jgi:HupE / UreJ protein